MRLLHSWILTNAVGFAAGFGLFLSISELIIGNKNMTSAFLGHFIGLMVFGIILAFSQSLVLNRQNIKTLKWIVSGALGFTLVMLVIWPLYLTKIWPAEGPIEPLIISLVSCTFLGLMVYIFYRKDLAGTGYFLIMWIIGAIAGIVISALLMIFIISKLGLPFIAEMAVFTLITGAIAGLISGGSIKRLIPHDPKH